MSANPQIQAINNVPSSFRCITNCASVHRSPASALALSTSKNPSRLNWVDWYVNRNRPIPMRETTAINDGRRCSRPNDSEKAKMKMIHVDLVIVYLFKFEKEHNIKKYILTPFLFIHIFRTRSFNYTLNVRIYFHFNLRGINYFQSIYI